MPGIRETWWRLQSGGKRAKKWAWCGPSTGDMRLVFDPCGEVAGLSLGILTKLDNPDKQLFSQEGAEDMEAPVIACQH